MSNPFRYQGPVRPELLINRAEELDALQHAAANRVGVRLAAARRFGKTSLLDAHIASMRDAGHRAVRVDLSKLDSVADAAIRVARAYSQLPADPRQTLQTLLGRLPASPSAPAGCRSRCSRRAVAGLASTTPASCWPSCWIYRRSCTPPTAS